ncbi:forkhead box protein N1 isoform 1-T1 [Synchiropus picturatus]
MEMRFQWSRFLCRRSNSFKSGYVTTTCHSMEQSQDGDDGSYALRESNTFISRAASMDRRRSVDGDSQRFHPYPRQLSEEGAGSLTCLPEVYRQDSSSRTPNSNMEAWEHYNTYPTVADSPIAYPSHDRSKYPHDPLQRSATHPLFPKPVYSYSILIFMALKNSKTGSLPVSEIYSFMTEHFPYFKTAPDGWKNSVRHNLSLNKCFEKVENKNGNASRKGCLWSLNPAKVEKMQEELHKWHRKDPVTVRRSMARPEELDHLFGERRSKVRPLPPYTGRDLLSRLSSSYSRTSVSLHSPPPPAPQMSWFPPANTSSHPGVFTPCSLCPVPAASGGLSAAVEGMMPPPYSEAQRLLPDWLSERDAMYDVDALNPSLVDLQLQGSLWEELREDSVVSEPPEHVPTTVAQSSGPSTAQFTGGGPIDEPYWTAADSLSGYMSCCTTSITLL